MSKAAATRDGFGEELAKLGKINDKIVMVSADLEDATRAEYFRDACPDRFFTVGIAEQDMVGTAAGMAKEGFIAFVNSFAVFMTNRAYDMIRIDVCYNNTNVKVICSHAGITVGPDGASAQSLEDLALMRVLPNMQVIVPVDTIEAQKATRAFTDYVGPQYMRTSRAPLPVLTDESTPFEIGKANVMRDGTDTTFIGCGVLVSSALSAAEMLSKEGISLRVINMHTIKPIDQKVIIEAAKETGAIVTGEEHQVAGGLGSAVAEVVVSKCPVPMKIMGMEDSFGQTGSPDQLLKEYHLTDQDIVNNVLEVLKKKKKLEV